MYTLALCLVYAYIIYTETVSTHEMMIMNIFLRHFLLRQIAEKFIGPWISPLRPYTLTPKTLRVPKARLEP